MKTFTTRQFARTISSPAEKIASSFTEKFLVALLLFIIPFNLSTQAQSSNFPSMTFHSPVLISGVNNEVNAVYLFANVCDGVDATITIVGISNGAALNNIDDTTGAGYYDAFQPYVNAAPNDSSYIDWKIDFKVAGTTRDTMLPKVAITGVDVDGDGAYLKEFIVASTPGTFGLAYNTFLHYAFDGVASTAISTVDNVPLIDTSERRAMFQMNFTNVSSILYRNGAVSTYGSAEIRQTCIYFKSFFEDQILLPIKLLSFNAIPGQQGLALNWSVTNEDGLEYYTAQKSTDGINWKNIGNVVVGSADVNSYSLKDFEANEGNVSYRLKLVAVSGSTTYSKIIEVNFKVRPGTNIRHNTIFNSNINLRISATENDEYSFAMYSIAGNKIIEKDKHIQSGINYFTIDVPVSAARGVYVLVIRNKTGRLVYNSRLLKN
jgi:hypothetical protein